MSRSSAKVTLDLGSEKRRKLLEELAKERDMTLQNVLLIALREWLERQEEEKYLQAIKDVENELNRSIVELLAELGESGLDEEVCLPGKAS